MTGRSPPARAGDTCPEPLEALGTGKAAFYFVFTGPQRTRWLSQAPSRTSSQRQARTAGGAAVGFGVVAAHTVSPPWGSRAGQCRCQSGAEPVGLSWGAEGWKASLLPPWSSCAALQGWELALEEGGENMFLLWSCAVLLPNCPQIVPQRLGEEQGWPSRRSALLGWNNLG